MEMLMKFAPASVATAFASIVLPVPGGPNNRIPLHGCMEGNSQSQYKNDNNLTREGLQLHITLMFVIFTGIKIYFNVEETAPKLS